MSTYRLHLPHAGDATYVPEPHDEHEPPAQAAGERRALVATAHRVNVNFSQTAYQTLEALAETKGKTMSEVLRDAVQLEKWITETYASGGRVLLEKDGSQREILVR